ncbi:hypothetical protein [Streptomyces mirabilis]
MFWTYLAGLVPAFLAVIVTPETVTARQRPAISVRRPTIPDGRAARTEFLRAATAVLAAFAVTGLFSSLVPSFLREQLHVHNVAAVGTVVGLWTRSLPTFVAGTLLAGTGIGLAFRRGVGVAQRLADPRRRADLLSTYFLFAYTGTIVPTLAPGTPRPDHQPGRRHPDPRRRRHCDDPRDRTEPPHHDRYLSGSASPLPAP